MKNQPTLGTMIIGCIIFLGVLAAWLYAESRDIDTSALLAFAVPVVSALFLSGAVQRGAEAAERAANQTNGALDGRIQAAVSAALANRDAARTRQARGDIAADTPSAAVTEQTFATAGYPRPEGDQA